MRFSRAKPTGSFRVFHPSTRRVAAHANTLREAQKDAAYWVAAMGGPFEIQERFPSGAWVTVETVSRFSTPATKRTKTGHATKRTAHATSRAATHAEYRVTRIGGGNLYGVRLPSGTSVWHLGTVDDMPTLKVGSVIRLFDEPRPSFWDEHSSHAKKKSVANGHARVKLNDPAAMIRNRGGHIKNFEDRQKQMNPEAGPRWTAYAYVYGWDVAGDGATKSEALWAALETLPAHLKRHFPRS